MEAPRPPFMAPIPVRSRSLIVPIERGDPTSTCIFLFFWLLSSFYIRRFSPLTLLVRALRLLRPTEVPVRPCRVPRDAKGFTAAAALDPAVDPTVDKWQKKKIKDILKTLHLPHIVMVIEDMAEMRQLKICLTKRSGHYQSSHMLNLDRWSQCIFTQIEGKWGLS